MADVVLKIDADASKAESELVKFAKSQEKVEKSAAGVQKRLKESHSSAGMLTGALFRLTAAGAGLATLGDAIRKIGENLDSAARRASEAHKAFVPLAGIQNPKMSEQASRMAQLLGARFGIGAADSADTVQEMQSILKGDLGAGLRAAQTVFGLQKLGAKNVDARNIESFGMAGGLSAAKAGAVGLMAADESKLSIGDYATAATGTATFKSPYAGAAAIAALSKGGFKVAELDNFSRQAGIALNTESELTKKIARTLKKQGVQWDSLNEIERVNAIAANVSDTSISGLMKAGLGDTEKARGLSQLIKERSYFSDLSKRLESAPEDLIAKRIEETAKSNPQIAAAWAIEANRASAQYADAWSPFAAKAQAAKVATTKVGAELSSMGYTSPFLGIVPYFDPETSEATVLGALAYGAMGGKRRKFGSGEFLGDAAAETALASRAKGQEGPDETSEILRELLAETRRSNEIAIQNSPASRNPIPATVGANRNE